MFPNQLEEPLRSHPDVREAVMFSGSGPDRLERVHAAVAVRPGARVTAEQLRGWAREHGDARCAPDTVPVLPAIPLNGLGEPDLSALRALAGEHRAAGHRTGGARGGVTRPARASSARVDHLSRGGPREETERGHSTVRAELPIHPGGAPSHRPQEALP
ncbi:hypothetical protein [Kitasatospora sp. NPDC017646]|uniref:AMP-binding enzyme n=1 Tax=Kitasatospora sp. NPDC017646 TaxID=3364024 RepID=UPI0037AFCBD0